VDWQPPIRKRGSRGVLVVAILASVLAVGLGYVASEQWRGGRSALGMLTKTQSELQMVAQERSRAQNMVTEQRAQLDERKLHADQDATEISDLKTKLGAAEARLNELEAKSDALNEHLTEFRALTKQFQRMIDSGKLQISFRRGRMIVELPAAVLFASGSAELSADGRQSLREIAKILRQVPGKRFMVGGHTDDVPIGKGAAYTSNWSLSSARAVTVTESLIEAGLRANHLVAAGYGEYDPIAGNNTDKGRQKNRRIEIVLEPELAALPSALSELQKQTAKPKPAAKAPAAKH
jgi:chemotaxis protein MotB